MLKKYNLQELFYPDSEIFSDKWSKRWHGMCMLNVCKASPESRKKKKVKKDRKVIKQKFGDDIIRASELEKHAFLSIMSNIKTESISMFELGAGRGDWVLSTAGAIKHQLVPTKAKKCRCLAVEGEPTHFKWTKTHVDYHKIDCICVHGGVTKSPGKCEFQVSEAPSDSYGQSIVKKGSHKKTVKLNAYSIDQLMEIHNFPRLDFIHMDVQGEECNVLHGAKRALKNGNIDYLMIGTHGRQGPDSDKKNREIRKIMEQYDYKIVLDVPPKKLRSVETVLGKAVADGDGFMFIVSNKVK